MNGEKMISLMSGRLFSIAVSRASVVSVPAPNSLSSVSEIGALPTACHDVSVSLDAGSKTAAVLATNLAKKVRPSYEERHGHRPS